VSATTKRILLVENDSTDARRVQECVSHAAPDTFSFIVAGCLTEVPGVVAAHPPDLVLLNLNLPDSSGLDSVSKMQALLPDVPIVVITGIDDEKLAIRVIHEGAQDYLEKAMISNPGLPRMLLYAIERHRLKAVAESHSVTDELTGLTNRRGFSSLARQHADLTQRRNGDLVLLYVELEGLQQIHHLLGPAAANRAVCEVAGVLRRCVRHTDVVGRLGGAGFAILAIDTEPAGAVIMQRRVEKEVRLRNFSLGRKYRLSLTLGAYNWRGKTEISLDALVARTDSAIAERNRIASPVSIVLAGPVELGRGA
jgi:diguanylate cyclase (GGDEF)-like protein